MCLNTLEIMSGIISHEIIENKIFLIRGMKILLDEDLAKMYQVSTWRLNEQVKRNIKRFPSDFMFQLTKKEATNLRSQIAISKRGGRRYFPYAFTEQGVAMLSSVLNSERAIQVNIEIMRIFVRLRKFIASHRKLAQKLNLLESKIEKHDEEIQSIFEAIRQLMSPPEKPKRKIGFCMS